MTTRQTNGTAPPQISDCARSFPTSSRAVLDAGLARLDAQLSEVEHGQHRWVLRYNRAQLIACLGQVEQAVRDHGDVIATDPNHSDYYLERAALLRQLGDNERALADYAKLCRLALPYPEAFYNRGDTKAELGVECATARPARGPQIRRQRRRGLGHRMRVARV